MFHQGRDVPLDGYLFECHDPDRIIAVLTRHGVARTPSPCAWIAERRRAS
jgi:hypothetical protein